MHFENEAKGVNQHSEQAVESRVIVLMAVSAVLFAGYGLFQGIEWQGSAELHTVMEALATLLAFMVGCMALIRFYTKQDILFLFIGAGFLGATALDGFHTLATSSFFNLLMPSDLPSLIPWSWIASRQFLSFFLLLSLLMSEMESLRGLRKLVLTKSVYAFTGLTIAACILFFTILPLPRAYYPEFIFHRPEEFLPAIFFGIALVGFLRCGTWRKNSFEFWLGLSLIVGLFSQAVFMPFSERLFDFEFDAAHLLKIISYFCVLTGLVVNMHGVFAQDENINQALAENVDRLLASESLNAAALSAFPDGILVFDDEMKLVAANSHFYEIFQLPEDSFELGTELQEVFRSIAVSGDFGPNDIVDMVAERMVAMHLPEACHFEIENRKGCTIKITRDIMEHGGLLSTYSDITEGKKRETQLRQARMDAESATAEALQLAEDAEMANRAKSEFLAMMSHEIRTPMNGVLATVDLLLESGLEADNLRRVQTVKFSAVSLMALLNDILDISKVESGRIDIEIADFDIYSLTDNITAFWTPKATSADLKWIWRIDSGVP